MRAYEPSSSLDFGIEGYLLPTDYTLLLADLAFSQIDIPSLAFLLPSFYTLSLYILNMSSVFYPGCHPHGAKTKTKT
jgi:predicted membrane channel-forming protein YqfA (hemolysin III family)